MAEIIDEKGLMEVCEKIQMDYKLNGYDIPVEDIRNRFDTRSGTYRFLPVNNEKCIIINWNVYPYISQFFYDAEGYNHIHLSADVLTQEFVHKTINPNKPILFGITYIQFLGDSDYLAYLEKADFIENLRIYSHHLYLLIAIKRLKNLKRLQIVLFDEDNDPHNGEEEYILKKPLDLSYFNDSKIELIQLVDPIEKVEPEAPIRDGLKISYVYTDEKRKISLIDKLIG